MTTQEMKIYTEGHPFHIKNMMDFFKEENSKSGKDSNKYEELANLQEEIGDAWEEIYHDVIPLPSGDYHAIHEYDPQQNIHYTREDLKAIRKNYISVRITIAYEFAAELKYYARKYGEDETG